MRLPAHAPPMDVCLDYCDTVNSNIEMFLKDKTKKMELYIENASQGFRTFWERIGAEGDIDAALSEFDIAYNASIPARNLRRNPLLPTRILRRFVLRRS